ncbi:hypothetical protein GCM10010964_05720 [Caldovatus sediminis]|uniref:Uncharacterized protein n=1 Tax=Caldovatus sediminis TaxID=2041189 RepID=A0A8J3EAX5_9PROT|nr:hypothetical protein GCM10010964_05720 [Caldovatus sediminis]
MRQGGEEPIPRPRGPARLGVRLGLVPRRNPLRQDLAEVLAGFAQLVGTARGTRWWQATRPQSAPSRTMEADRDTATPMVFRYRTCTATRRAGAIAHVRRPARGGAEPWLGRGRRVADIGDRAERVARVEQIADGRARPEARIGPADNELKPLLRPQPSGNGSSCRCYGGCPSGADTHGT